MYFHGSFEKITTKQKYTPFSAKNNGIFCEFSFATSNVICLFLLLNTDSIKAIPFPNYTCTARNLFSLQNIFFVCFIAHYRIFSKFALARSYPICLLIDLRCIQQRIDFYTYVFVDSNFQLSCKFIFIFVICCASPLHLFCIAF